MKVRTTILFPVFLLSVMSFIFVGYNKRYFSYLSDNSATYHSDFDLISGFIGGDSRFYYSIDSNILEIIFLGFSSGGVEFGSILSLVGIYYYVKLASLIFGDKVLGVLVLNLFLIGIILKSLNMANSRTSFTVLFLFPLTFNYVLVPNKEIFSLLLISLLLGHRFAFKRVFFWVVSFIRDIYMANLIFFALARFFDIRILLLLFFVSVPFVLPASYFDNSDLISNQASGDITTIANTLLQYPIINILGFFIKIVLGLFSGIILDGISNASIIELQYFLCSCINLIFLLKIVADTKFRKNLFQKDKNILIVGVVFAIFMSLAPGNPARFLAPLTFVFVYKLKTWKV